MTLMGVRVQERIQFSLVNVHPYIKCLDAVVLVWAKSLSCVYPVMSCADCHLSVRTMRNKFLIHEDFLNYK